MARVVQSPSGMEIRNARLLSTLLATATLFVAAPALALDFQVHGYDLGERIQLQTGRQVWTAELDVSLDTVADHVSSFCVDLDTHIGVGTYSGAEVYDAITSPAGPSPSGPRAFAWAGHVMSRFGHDLDPLVGDGITRDHAITGVQAAIWEGLYGGTDDTIDRRSLSSGARSVFDQIMGEWVAMDWQDAPGLDALVVDLPHNQDQILVVSNPVPEPSAALVFGLGTVVVGRFARRRD
ncbi:MAG: thioester domain-containing protein [Myxococcota bacterium]